MNSHLLIRHELINLQRPMESMCRGHGNLLSSITAVGSSVHNWIVYSFMVEAIGDDVLTFPASGIEESESRSSG
jgi:hypothetical protein